MERCLITNAENLWKNKADTLGNAQLKNKKSIY